VSHLVFADPDIKPPERCLRIRSSSSATPRRARPGQAYLFARRSSAGMPKAPPRPPMPRETLAALRTEQLWDVLGIRLNWPKARASNLAQLDFTDTGETFVLTPRIAR